MIDHYALTRRYFQAIGVPNETSLNDPAYHRQLTFVRDMISHLSEILATEGISDETAGRIVNTLLFGAPTEEEGRKRTEQAEQLFKRVAAAEQITEQAMRKALGLPTDIGA